MAYRIDDSEEARWIDRIRAITFREAKEAGASFISRSWVAKKINRSEDFVKRNWKKDPYSCFMQQENPGTETLNELREETDLFVKPLHSYPLRLQAIRLANGGHTKF